MSMWILFSYLTSFQKEKKPIILRITKYARSTVYVLNFWLEIYVLSEIFKCYTAMKSIMHEKKSLTKLIV